MASWPMSTSALCAACAQRVVAPDNAEAALELSRKNVAANAGRGGCPVDVRRYAWGADDEAEALHAQGDFDLVLGADIMYDAAAPYPALSGDLLRMLAPGGRVILAYAKVMACTSCVFPPS